MRNNKKIIAMAVCAACSTPAFAQLGGLFQGVLENAAKQAIQQGAEQGIQQGVAQAIAGASAQQPGAAAPAAAPVVQNGCYFNLPAMPPGVQFNADLNGNGCVDQNEYATYLQVYQSALLAATQRQAAASTGTPAATNNAVGAALGSAIAVRNAGLTGNAAGWVAGQNALGAAVHAARAQAAQQQPMTVAPVGVAAPATGVEGVVGNAAAEVVSGAVSGALKGLFGR